MRFCISSHRSRYSQHSAFCFVWLTVELPPHYFRRQSVLYHLLDWPTRAHSRLVVVAVANTMDLPERMLPRVASRLGMGRISFAPYNKADIKTIVEDRLSRLHGTLFDDAAVMMVSAKVAQISGDVRRALQISQRAVELVRRERVYY